MPKITLTKEEAQAIVGEDHETAEIVVDNIIDTGRWSIRHSVIFKLNGKFYKTFYQVGATEQQEEAPFEHNTEVICTEVEPYEKTVIDYRAVKDVADVAS